MIGSVDYDPPLYTRALAAHTRLQRRYEIVREVAQGGFGITYEAFDLDASCSVALKELLPTELAHRERDGISVRANCDDEAFDDALKEFAEEAERLRAFDHPNIVKFLDYFTANGTGYLVMEWLQDRTLRSMLSDQDSERLVIGQERLLAYLRGLLDGMEAIHGARLIHRDIKPENICLRENGTPVILDFGASRLLGRQRSVMAGMFTDGFAPLEQYLPDAHEQGPWSDNYGLGATLYACIAGRDPASSLKRAYAICRRGADPLGEVDSKAYSPILLKTIMTLLNLDRNRRPQELSVVRKALRFLLEPCRDERSGAANERMKLKPGDIWCDTLSNGTPGPEMVCIPAGEFRMGGLTVVGLPCEQPVRSVDICSPFLMGQYSVTSGEYAKFVQAAQYPAGDFDPLTDPRMPAVQVSWYDACSYIDWLSAETGSAYRLPSEAEWEYAARAGSECCYPWGNRVGRRNMNTDNSRAPWSGRQMAPVGSFASNAFGLFDTSGNVWEWCADPWHEDYEGAPDDSRTWVKGGRQSARVVRGGCWSIGAENARSSCRSYDNPDNRIYLTGFRIVQDM